MSQCHPDVMPVVHKLIQIFKYPPEPGAENEELHEKFRLIHEQALAGSEKGEGVDADDIAKPKQWEGLWLQRLEPGETGPGDCPGTDYPSPCQPTPPGKLSVW